MEPLGHDAIRFRHLGDLCKQVAFPFRSVLVGARFSLQLSGALFHRGAFLGSEPLDLLASGRGAPGGFLGILIWAHNNLLVQTRVGNLAA